MEWLEPIAGPDISARALYLRLRTGKTPHVVHWVGHGGVDSAGKPELRLADDEDGEPVWIAAEAVGRELAGCFATELRLIILEACEGAKEAAFGSAAEILAKAGADAVVAHLWPVKADVARICSSEIYRSLTAPGWSRGDIGASVAAARRTLLSQSAEAFSPVLYLRSAGTVIFRFEGSTAGSLGTASRKKRPVKPATKDVWMVIEGLEFFTARPGAQVRVVANVNGTELTYPSLGGVEWLEVGPSMSAQVFRLPPARERYVVRFEAAVRVPGARGEADVMGKLTSVKEDIVDAVEGIPFSGRYVLHTFDPVHRARSANANAVLVYRLTDDPT